LSKLSYVAAVLALGAALTACEGSPDRGINTPPAPSVVMPGESFTLQQGQIAMIGETGDRLSFIVTEDSRCPRDVMCVQAGQVVIRVEISGADGTATTMIASPAAGPNSADAGDYHVTFGGIEPPAAPAGGSFPHGDYIATLLLETRP